MKMKEITRSKISNEELRELEAEVLEVPLVVLSHTTPVEEMEAQCVALSDEVSVLGLDTETKPTFTRGCSHKVSLLQLATADRALLIRLEPELSQEQLASVRRLLEDRKITKVGVGIGDDAKGLWGDRRLRLNRMVDLRLLSKAAGIEVLSLSKIYAVLFGKRISKGQRLSDWEREELTEAQLDYAALDAVAGLRIYQALEGWLNEEMYRDLEGLPKEKAKRSPRKSLKRGRTAGGAKAKEIKSKMKSKGGKVAKKK